MVGGDRDNNEKITENLSKPMELRKMNTRYLNEQLTVILSEVWGISTVNISGAVEICSHKTREAVRLDAIR